MFSRWATVIRESIGTVNIKKKSNVWTQEDCQGIDNNYKQINKIIIGHKQI